MALGLQPMLKHENGSGSRKCFGTQTHSHKYGRMQEKEFKTIQNGKDFGNYNSMKIPCR
jgi:hypothetical protein